MSDASLGEALLIGFPAAVTTQDGWTGAASWGLGTVGDGAEKQVGSPQRHYPRPSLLWTRSFKTFSLLLKNKIYIQ